MAHLRIENFRFGNWSLRGEGEIPDDTSMEVIKANVDGCALNHESRALLNGVVVYETKKLTKKRAAARFGLGG